MLETWLRRGYPWKKSRETGEEERKGKEKVSEENFCCWFLNKLSVQLKGPGYNCLLDLYGENSLICNKTCPVHHLDFESLCKGLR